MEYLIGAALGAAIAGSARALRYDEDRSFFPVVLIVIATYYVLFAVMSGRSAVIVTELGIALLFSAVAVLGGRISLGVVAAGLVGHGAFDLAHHAIVENPSVPLWWPGFCAAVDGVLGLAVILAARKRRSELLRPVAGGNGSH